MEWPDFTPFCAVGKGFGMCGGMAKAKSLLRRDELGSAGLE
jgi:hypothetical protein